MQTPPFGAGDRIRLVRMCADDPDPIPPGSEGTVARPPTFFQNAWDVSVNWDNGRSLGLVVPPDQAVKI